MRVAVLALIAGCSRPVAPAADAPASVPPDQVRHYTIWLGGARVGTATENETWTRDGVHLERTERLQFLRGDAEVVLATAIEIDADPQLVARRVTWSERGTDVRRAEARRGPAGWKVSTGEQLAQTAVPAELVPLIIRRDGTFTGDVFLPARGFVAGKGRIEPVAAGRLIARLALDAGPVVEATIDLDTDRAPARVVDGDGVIAIRATAAQAREPFPAVDLIAATAIPITGERGASDRLLLASELALPALPGQRVSRTADGVEVELDTPAATPGDRISELRTLVAAVRARITPDLGASPASVRDATTATAGDCTTFALAYAALASRAGIPTRVVTGLRVDGDRLIRHRWAVSWTGARWIPIDAAFGAAPAGGNLIGLAIHDADDAGLVSGEAALTQVRAATWLR